MRSPLSLVDGTGPAWPVGVETVGDVPESATVLDLAAKTGKLTRLLVTRFARVIAVEPLDPMPAILEQLVPERSRKPSPRRRFRCRTRPSSRSMSRERSTGSAATPRSSPSSNGCSPGRVDVRVVVLDDDLVDDV